MKKENKIIAGVLFAASLGFAVKSALDIRALKKAEQEEDILEAEVMEDELQDEESHS